MGHRHVLIDSPYALLERGRGLHRVIRLSPDVYVDWTELLPLQQWQIKLRFRCLAQINIAHVGYDSDNLLLALQCSVQGSADRILVRKIVPRQGLIDHDDPA